jgi:hypothetical protein
VRGEFSREIGLLRTVTKNLVSGPTAQDALRARGFARASEVVGGLVAILRPGHEAFSDLSASVIERSPAMGRGSHFAIFESELFGYVADHFVGCDAAAIGPSDVDALLNHIEEWFASVANPCTIFVPCVVSPWAAARFSVGPIDFIFVNDVAQSEFYPHGEPDDVGSREGFDKMLQLMRDMRANWLACVPVEGCEQHRAEEIGSLAVDLAIVALQLAEPYVGTRTMSRLDSRRGAADKFTVSRAGGHYSSGWTRMDAGMAIGPGTLADILQRHQRLIESVGNCVRSFASGRFRVPALEQAWCDAAYWLHQALAESMDSIAIAKLETALEVLLHSESSSGSQSRILTILGLFFGLKPDDPIMQGSSITAKQFARDVVGDRSRILHGTWSTLNSRLARNRGGLENFVITTIQRTVLELEEYIRSPSPSDSIDDFLSWIKRRQCA